MSARLGRHALLMQARSLARLRTIDEPMVFDHFETFTFSQEDRLGIATVVGQRSWFVYGIDPAPHRRSGRRSRRKQALRQPLPPRVPGSVVQSTRRVLDLIAARAPRGFDLVSDDHPAYAVAVSSHPRRGAIRRRVYANPPRGEGADTRAARIRDREMFAVDLLHKLWRHTQAHHRRETIAFGRRSNALLERAALFAVWRNFVKSVTERVCGAPTPAMRLGLARRPLGWRQVFARRLFPDRIELPPGWIEIYRRQWVTPAVGRNSRHTLAHAF